MSAVALFSISANSLSSWTFRRSCPLETLWLREQNSSLILRNPWYAGNGSYRLALPSFLQFMNSFLICAFNCRTLFCNRGFWGILALWLSERCPATYRAFIGNLDSFCYRQDSKAFTEAHLSYKTRSQLYFDNSISLT